MLIRSAKDLDVYKKAYTLSMDIDQHKRLTDECRVVGSMLGKMLGNPQPFIFK